MAQSSFKTLVSVSAIALSLAFSACNQAISAEESIVTGVAYVGATVGDVEKTAAFYSQVSGMAQIQDLDISDSEILDKLAARTDVNMSTRMLQSVNAQVRYMEFENVGSNAKAYKAVPVNGPGIAHLCFQVNATTGTYQKFLEAGANHIGSPDMQIVNAKNPVEYAYVNDMDGLVVEIEHVDLTKLDLETPPEHDYRIRHISLASPDIDRLTKFYSAFLGEKKPRKIGRFGGIGNEAMSLVSGFPETKIKMAWFQLKNLELEIIEYTSHPVEALTTSRPIDALGYNMIVFDVTDLESAKSKFINAGGTIITEPGPMDGGQIMFGRDPDLNLIGFQVPGQNSVASSSKFKNNGT